MVNTDSLTEREREIVRMTQAGKSGQQIGAALNLNGATIQALLKSAMAKLGVSSRTALSRLPIV